MIDSIFAYVFASAIVAIFIILSGVAGSRALMWLYTRLRNETQGYPLENEIEAALLPHIHAAIYAVHKFTIESLRAGAEIDAEQKRAAFAELYRVMVPEHLRLIVNPELWNTWGNVVYDTMRNSSNAVADHLEGEFIGWRAENEEPGA